MHSLLLFPLARHAALGALLFVALGGAFARPAAAQSAAAQTAKAALGASAFAPRDSSVAGLRRAVDSLRALGAGESGRTTAAANATDAALAMAHRRLARALEPTDPSSAFTEYRLSLRMATQLGASD